MDSEDLEYASYEEAEASQSLYESDDMTPAIDFHPPTLLFMTALFLLIAGVISGKRKLQTSVPKVCLSEVMKLADVQRFQQETPAKPRIYEAS